MLVVSLHLPFLQILSLPLSSCSGAPEAKVDDLYQPAPWALASEWTPPMGSTCSQSEHRRGVRSGYLPPRPPLCPSGSPDSSPEGPGFGRWRSPSATAVFLHFYFYFYITTLKETSKTFCFPDYSQWNLFICCMCLCTTMLHTLKKKHFSQPSNWTPHCKSVSAHCQCHSYSPALVLTLQTTSSDGPTAVGLEVHCHASLVHLTSTSTLVKTHCIEPPCYPFEQALFFLPEHCLAQQAIENGSSELLGVWLYFIFLLRYIQ